MIRSDSWIFALLCIPIWPCPPSLLTYLFCFTVPDWLNPDVPPAPTEAQHASPQQSTRSVSRPVPFGITITAAPEFRPLAPPSFRPKPIELQAARTKERKANDSIFAPRDYARRMIFDTIGPVCPYGKLSCCTANQWHLANYALYVLSQLLRDMETARPRDVNAYLKYALQNAGNKRGRLPVRLCDDICGCWHSDMVLPRLAVR
eukprot:SAG31_NODE_12141_length_964_cov_1.995376_1_plen_204_part_00